MTLAKDRRQLLRKIASAEIMLEQMRALLTTPVVSSRKDGPVLLEGVERAHILKVLEDHGGNRRDTAEALGIGERSLYRKLLKWGNG